MRSLPLLGLSLAAVLVLAACTSGGAASASAPAASAGASPAAPATAAGLDGRTFVSASIEGHALAPESQVRLTFDGIHLAISAGCNQMGGEYSMTDGVLALGQLMSTEMACEEPLMRQDTWLGGFLPGAFVSLSGDTLTITNEGVSLTLVDETVASPAQGLEGTRWVVDGIVSNDAVSTVPAGTTASLTLDGGTVRVEAGCNTGSGTYKLGDADITFGPIATTRMACAEDAMALEAAVLQVLTGQASYAIDGGSLTLQNGTAGLTLRAAS